MLFVYHFENVKLMHFLIFLICNFFKELYKTDKEFHISLNLTFNDDTIFEKTLMIFSHFRFFFYFEVKCNLKLKLKK